MITMNKSLLLPLATLAAAMMTGCTIRTADVTLCSTKNIYVKGVDVTKLPQKTGVEAEGDWKFLNIGLNFKDPVDKALETGGGNMMIDAVWYVKTMPLFSKAIVRGTVVNVPSQGTAPMGTTPTGTANPMGAGTPR